MRVPLVALQQLHALQHVRHQTLHLNLARHNRHSFTGAGEERVDFSFGDLPPSLPDYSCDLMMARRACWSCFKASF